MTLLSCLFAPIRRWLFNRAIRTVKADLATNQAHLDMIEEDLSRPQLGAIRDDLEREAEELRCRRAALEDELDYCVQKAAESTP